MNDGIDHRAFLAELKGLDADTRRKRRLEFVAWTRAAAGSLGAGAWISPALLLIGIEGIFLSFVLPEPRALVASAFSSRRLVSGVPGPTDDALASGADFTRLLTGASVKFLFRSKQGAARSI